MTKITTTGRISLGKSKINKKVIEIDNMLYHKEEVTIACGGAQSIYSEVQDDWKRILYQGSKRG